MSNGRIMDAFLVGGCIIYWTCVLTDGTVVVGESTFHPLEQLTLTDYDKRRIAEEMIGLQHTP